MKVRFWARVLIVVVGLTLAIGWLVHRAAPPAAEFAGVVGPQQATPVIAPKPIVPDDFAGGSDHRLAILVTDPDSGWLGLARGLNAHGIPFSMTTNVTAALRHRVVYVYPVISGARLHAADFDALRRHVASGGSLLTFDVEGGGMHDLFGVAGPPVATPANEMRWADPAAGADPVVRVSRSGTEAKVGALAYRAAGGTTLASFGADGVALACRSSAGRACALGVDVGTLSERAMNGREEAVANTYVNGFESSLDDLYRWIADFYVQGEPMPWLIDTAPAGKDLTVLLTHDIDFTHAVSSAATYAAALKRLGANATFFMQTKYVRDYNDDVFFNPRTIPYLLTVKRLGMEIGSHSVAHSRVMKKLPMGSGDEQYPSYHPFVESRTQTRDATVLGEVRVSRFLLQRLVGADVQSFRAGYLSNPFGLPQALAASGYRYDSSLTANSTLSHLPYQLTYDRADRGLEPVYEFPVTIEDEAKPPLIDRLASANQVIGRIADRHGLAVILVHPDDTSRKLEFEEAIARDWRQRAWLASMREFGDWWRARDDARIDVTGTPGAWKLDIASDRPLHNLTVRLPKLAGTARRLSPGLRWRGSRLTIDAPAGHAQATF